MIDIEHQRDDRLIIGTALELADVLESFQVGQVAESPETLETA